MVIPSYSCDSLMGRFCSNQSHKVSTLSPVSSICFLQFTLLDVTAAGLIVTGRAPYGHTAGRAALDMVSASRKRSIVALLRHSTNHIVLSPLHHLGHVVLSLQLVPLGCPAMKCFVQRSAISGGIPVNSCRMSVLCPRLACNLVGGVRNAKSERLRTVEPTRKS